jgi:excisionase family DNA binding protein
MDRLRISPVASARTAHLVGMSTEMTTGSGLEPLMSIEDLAEYLGVPVNTIYDWRVTGRGPCAIKVGRHLKFAVGDVREWLARQRESSPGRMTGGR